MPTYVGDVVLRFWSLAWERNEGREEWWGLPGGIRGCGGIDVVRRVGGNWRGEGERVVAVERDFVVEIGERVGLGGDFVR